MPNVQPAVLAPVMEALQMRRDIAAYHLAASGEFKKEFDRLEKLLDEIKKANAPKDLMKQAEGRMKEAERLSAEVAEQRKWIDTEKTKTAQQQASEAEKLTKRQSDLTLNERYLTERQAAMVTLESKNAALQATLDKRAKDFEAGRIAAEADMTALRASLQKREQDLAVKERAVAEKFEKMRSIAVA